ncbi:GNAT family N-acetyltransferase [Shewanella intestini]|uniref:GNAT family N-acetyltransferase n=1 Tax=Shewanella intestini TaxID=2017544 RepID=A0ABS5I3P3_9GAMM|nr:MULTISPECIES: GNAT family N-acetyltransferase [Shewanella]MBR9728526.1 GNAT family N-acetyltransferase [Shewanella intestini]MRG36345.1 GNAT family N-acetyltransferase [Shewanella sp. XMDDZSB0408]
MNVNFTSETLSMHLISQGEFELFSMLYSNPKTMRKICQPFSKQQINAAFNLALNKTVDQATPYWMWVIKHNGDAIGLQSLGMRKPHAQFADIGLMLLQHANGKSHAINATVALMSVGFKLLGFSRIYADFDSTNLATKRITKRLNFIIESNETQDKHAPKVQKTTTCYVEAENWQFPLPKTNNNC